MMIYCSDDEAAEAAGLSWNLPFIFLVGLCSHQTVDIQHTQQCSCRFFLLLIERYKLCGDKTTTHKTYYIVIRIAMQSWYLDLAVLIGSSVGATFHYQP